jgi:hypothetical protein
MNKRRTRQRVVVDTNVPVVANYDQTSPTSSRGDRIPTISCQLKAIEALLEAIEKYCILLDIEGSIQDEYGRQLNPRGQPGVGDRFYLEVINSAPGRIERVELRKREDGEYEKLPQRLIDCGFDRNDRKFAALAKQEGAAVFNAVDSDWIDHADSLRSEDIIVNNLCGCDRRDWFQT